MSYKGPMLIKEPELRWPIVLLAALMTGVIALLVVVMHYVASTSSSTDTSSSKRLEWMVQPGGPDFDEFKQQITVEQVLGNEKVHPFNNLAKEIPANVITMRSTVRLKDLVSGDENTYSLVFPTEADFSNGKIFSRWQVNHEARNGSAAFELLNRASEWQPDLIVVALP